MTEKIDPRVLVHELIEEHFPDAEEALFDDNDTEIASLGDEESVDSFFEDLESRAGGSLFLSDREEKVATVGGVIAWVDSVRRENLASNWKDAITPLQRTLLAGSWALGMALIGLSLVWKAPGQVGMNQPLFALGIFIAAQLKFGIEGLYRWLAEKFPAMVEKRGHAGLFWMVLIGAYLLSLVEIGLFLAFFGIGT